MNLPSTQLRKLTKRHHRCGTGARALIIALVLIGIVIADGATMAQPIMRIATPLFVSAPGNPYQSLSLPSIITTIAVFDPLVLIDSDGDIQPWLATSWETEDGRVWRLRLRRGVSFSSGRPLTADAVVASVAHMQTPVGRAETVGASLVDITRAVALSDHEVEIQLADPDPLFALRLAMWRLPEPESWTQSTPADRATSVAGTGPFVPVARAPGSMTFTANSQAWNPPVAERLEILLVPEQVARLQALASGAVDLALDLGVGDRAAVENAGARLVRRLTAPMDYISFAVEHVPTSPIADRRVRQALNYAVNKTAITEILLDGYVEPVGQLAAPGAAGYDPSLEPYPYDIERAKALLADAGFPNGLAISIRVSPEGSDQMSIFQQVAADMRRAGVDLTVQLAPSGQKTTMLFAGDFGTELAAAIARSLDPLSDYRFRSCLGLVGDFKPFFCDAENIALVAQARTATTMDSAIRLTRQVLINEHQNPPGIFLWETLVLDGVSRRMLAPDSYDKYYDFLHLHQFGLATP